MRQQHCSKCEHVTRDVWCELCLFVCVCVCSQETCFPCGVPRLCKCVLPMCFGRANRRGGSCHTHLHCLCMRACPSSRTRVVHAAMPAARRCQRCHNHRPRSRRQCFVCLRMVGPGCWPERCLALDYNRGGPLCRDCIDDLTTRMIPMLAASIDQALILFAESGF